MWLLFEFYLSTDIDNIKIMSLMTMENPLIRSLSIQKAWIQKDFKFVMQRMVGN